jgi:SAM-dependent methyltransferase
MTEYLEEALNSFTAHNIRLDDGSVTMPNVSWTIDQHPVFLSARKTLQLIFSNRLHGQSIADLGCLEGGFATEFARLGMIATGIEVRESNIRNCLYTKSRVNLPNLNFIKDDVMHIENQGPFDVIFANGLLYHLDRPKAFLSAASAVCRRAIILHTHVAHRRDTPSRNYHRLSDLDQNEGMLGRWYTERGSEQLTTEQLDELKWHSWNNYKSFWIEKGDLLRTLQEVGFDTVYEQFDWLGHTGVNEDAYAERDRVMLVGIKSGPSSPTEVSRKSTKVLKSSTSWTIASSFKGLLKGLRTWQAPG